MVGSVADPRNRVGAHPPLDRRPIRQDHAHWDSTTILAQALLAMAMLIGFLAMGMPTQEVPYLCYPECPVLNGPVLNGEGNLRLAV